MISIVSGVIRGLPFMKRLRYCFKQQTCQNFEQVIVYDGPAPPEIIDFFENEMKIHSNLKFFMTETREDGHGSNPRNMGATQASGDFIVFCDDDDVYTPDYIKSFEDANPDNNTIVCLQMNIYGEVLPRNPCCFPSWGDVGTPQCSYPIHWFREPHNIRWHPEGDHDYDIVAECCNNFHPQIKLVQGIVPIIVRGDIKTIYPSYLE